MFSFPLLLLHCTDTLCAYWAALIPPNLYVHEHNSLGSPGNLCARWLAFTICSQYNINSSHVLVGCKSTSVIKQGTLPVIIFGESKAE